MESGRSDPEEGRRGQRPDRTNRNGGQDRTSLGQCEDGPFKGPRRVSSEENILLSRL